MSVHTTPVVTLLEHRVLSVRGPDARKFLQGQLSQEVLSLTPGEVRRASLNNPQGRCLVLLDVVAENDTDLLCLTTAPQQATLMSTLRRYVLRSKLRLEDETAHYVLQGHWQRPPSDSDLVPPSIEWLHAADGRWRSLTRRTAADVAGAEAVTEPEHAVSTQQAARHAWHRADIAAGLPRLEARTEGEFVAQMLNLDVLEAISFKKGCYTGQEVIARAHFRGRVKRRLQRFQVNLSAGEAAPVPGQSLTLSDGRSATVVDVVNAATDETPQWQCLAVTTYAGPALPEALPLPYALPD